LTVELWRDQVKQRPLGALLSEEAEGPPPLESIQNEILARLTSHASQVIGDDQRTHRVVNREFELLYLRGVRVLAVNLYGLYLPREVRDERIRHWRERWASAIRVARPGSGAPGGDAVHVGDPAGRLAFPLALTAGLRDRLNRGDHPSLRDTVAMILHQALQLSTADAVWGVPSSIADGLEQAAKEVEDLDLDCQARPREGER
jgi:hypothetical protein